MNTKRPNQKSTAAKDKTNAFGEFVRDLRTSVSVDETQSVFAERFHKSRNYITNIERGDFYPAEFAEDLVKQFPDYEARIRESFDSTLKNRPQKAPRRSISSLQRQVENYIRTGRFVYARRAIMQGLDSVSDEGERQWLFERLHAALTGLGQQDAAIQALQNAIECAIGAGLVDAEISCRIRLANRYQIPAKFQLAHEVLDAGLLRYPSAGRLWLQKGKVYWYEEVYSPAYAALTTALRHGSDRQSVLHARGQVLAEWGSFTAALTDIEDYLAFDNHNVISEASVRSARAYIWGVTGQLGQALQEFEAITPNNPDSAWLYYRRALCYIQTDDKSSAMDDLRRAIEKDSPKLNPPRYAHAVALLNGAE